MEVTHPKPDTQRALEGLVRLSQKYPALRIMQLLGNALGERHMRPDGEGKCNDPYYVGDVDLLTELEAYEEKVDQQVANMRREIVEELDRASRE